MRRPPTGDAAKRTDLESARAGLARPSRLVTVVGVLVAAWCAAFAAVNVWFEATDKFATGPHAAEADALSVANWYVFCLKLLGVAAALLAITRQPRRPSPRIVGTVLWGAFATIAIYAVGSIGQAIALASGVTGDAEPLGADAVAYVVGFLVAGVGFGILAISYARRARLGRREAVVGICGAPFVLGSILVALPAVLRATGVLSG